MNTPVLFASSFDPLPAAVSIATLLLVAALGPMLWRGWKGPSVADRVLSLDLAAGLVLAAMVLLAVRFGDAVYLDAAVVLAVIGFVGTAAFARSLETGGDD